MCGLSAIPNGAHIPLAPMSVSKTLAPARRRQYNPPEIERSECARGVEGAFPAARDIPFPEAET